MEKGQWKEEDGGLEGMVLPSFSFVCSVATFFSSPPRNKGNDMQVNGAL